eukprot:1814364-Prymnesium_polylepis.1
MLLAVRRGCQPTARTFELSASKVRQSSRRHSDALEQEVVPRKVVTSPGQGLTPYLVAFGFTA